MISISDMILYENENSTLDFKKIMYDKKNFHELIMDILSFANAHTPGDKFIIIGVKPLASGGRELCGIESESLSDQSTYQQLVNSNIQPDINLECFLHRLDNKHFGVFRIVNPTDRPYLLKKDYGKLRLGTALIRKGTLKMPLSRADFDSIYTIKNLEKNFNGIIQIELSKFENINGNQIVFKQLSELPSDRARSKITRLIEIKKNEVRNKTAQIAIPHIPNLMFTSPTPFEHRSLETLKDDLKLVAETYMHDDLFELSSKCSIKINFDLLNKGNRYLEDCSVQVLFPKMDEIFLLDKIYKEPDPEYSVLKPISISFVGNVASFDDINYPSFSDHEDYYLFESNIGDLKHNIPTQVFLVPFRVVFLKLPEPPSIIVKIKIFGRNLINPIENELIIKFK